MWRLVVWRNDVIPWRNLGVHRFREMPEVGDTVEVRGENWEVAGVYIAFIHVRKRETKR